MDKFDPHRNKERFENWKKEALEYGIACLNKKHSDIVLKYITDMERGENVARGSRKGGRSHVRLNALRVRVVQIINRLQERGVKDITKLTENKAITFFNDMSSGKITRNDGSQYKSVRDFVRDFKSFWNWLSKVKRKEGVILEDITSDLDTTKKHPGWVYFTLDELKEMQQYFSEEEQLRNLFMFDTIIRSPTELMNVKVSDLHDNFTELTIREETSKTYGRTIKILLCSEAIKEFVRKENKSPEDYLFSFSAPAYNKKIKRVALKVFGDKVTKGGKSFKDITMYDFRHNGACHWRLGAYKTKIDALMYRGGWNKLDTLNYYTQKLGMKDSIEKSDLLVEMDRNEYDKKFKDLERKFNFLLKINKDFVGDDWKHLEKEMNKTPN